MVEIQLKNIPVLWGEVRGISTLAIVCHCQIIAIDVNDPIAPQLDDINDVEKHMPGLLAVIDTFSNA